MMMKSIKSQKGLKRSETAARLAASFALLRVVQDNCRFFIALLSSLLAASPCFLSKIAPRAWRDANRIAIRRERRKTRPSSISFRLAANLAKSSKRTASQKRSAGKWTREARLAKERPRRGAKNARRRDNCAPGRTTKPDTRWSLCGHLSSLDRSAVCPAALTAAAAAARPFGAAWTRARPLLAAINHSRPARRTLGTNSILELSKRQAN